MNSLYQKFNAAKKANNNEHYSTISVRTPVEIASMVETVSAVTQEAVMNMFTGNLSEYLADYLLSDSNNITLIEQVLEEEYKKHNDVLQSMVQGSCIEILEEKDAIEIKDYVTFSFKKSTSA